MSWDYVASSASYIGDSSAYIADTATSNAQTYANYVSDAGAYITETVADNKNLQGDLANGVATQNAMSAQDAARAEAISKIEAAKADTLAKQDDDLRRQAKAASSTGLAGNLLTGGRGVDKANEKTSRILLGV